MSLSFVDRILNSTTMYRLVLCGLAILAAVSLVMGAVGMLPFTVLWLIVSLVLFVGATVGCNAVFSKFYRVPANFESSIITGLILFFLIAPPLTADESVSFFGTAVLASAVAAASKYVLAFHKRHVVNPAAFSAFVLGLLGNPNVTWWIGSKPLVPFTALIGLLIVQKIRRFAIVGSFLCAWLLASVVVSVMGGLSPVENILFGFVSGPVIFFATIMLTEPLTSPPDKSTRIVFGALVGVVSALRFHIGPMVSTPELALVIGNIFAYAVGGNRQRFELRLLEKRELAPEIFEFVFETDARVAFRAGQYVEWTLPHANPDSRGIRRYFTIASSPTERVLRFCVRIGQSISSFKTSLQSLPVGGVIYAGHLMGDFVLPKNANQKFVFIAGGIGITPFRSMIQYLLDTNQRRDIVLLYACASSKDFVYMDVFEHARERFDLKIVRIVTDAKNCEPGFPCRIGYIDERVLREEVPDFANRIFYLSGPVAMVKSYKQLLASLSIPARSVITDYFPGF